MGQSSGDSSTTADVVSMNMPAMSMIRLRMRSTAQAGGSMACTKSTIIRGTRAMVSTQENTAELPTMIKIFAVSCAAASVASMSWRHVSDLRMTVPTRAAYTADRAADSVGVKMPL